MESLIKKINIDFMTFEQRKSAEKGAIELLEERWYSADDIEISKIREAIETIKNVATALNNLQFFHEKKNIQVVKKALNKIQNNRPNIYKYKRSDIKDEIQAEWLDNTLEYMLQTGMLRNLGQEVAKTHLY